MVVRSLLLVVVLAVPVIVQDKVTRGALSSGGKAREYFLYAHARAKSKVQGIRPQVRLIADAPILEAPHSEEALLMNRDELDGKVDQVKGKVKQATGDLTDNERLHDEGVADEASGNVQEGFGRGRRKVGEAIEDLGEKLKR